MGLTKTEQIETAIKEMQSYQKLNQRIYDVFNEIELAEYQVEHLFIVARILKKQMSNFSKSDQKYILQILEVLE